MFHYLLYKTTNLLNGKIYIGIHKTKNINDGYMGSGKLLFKAIEKYGRENFQTEILLDCLSLKDLLRLEVEIVNEDFVQRDDTYNLKIGGSGGFDYVNKNGLNKFFCKVSSQRLKDDEKYRIEFSEKVKSSLKKSERWKSYNAVGRIATFGFLKKKHTEESKKKIGEANSKHQSGEGNSQYGTMWITNGEVNKKIKKDELIPEGFRKGRKYESKMS